MAKTKSKKPVESCPHVHDKGYESNRQNKITGSWNVLYRKSEDDETETAKWSVLCSAHATLYYVNLKRKATSMLLHPEEWCSVCKNTKETEEAKRFLDVSKERPFSDQMKMLANLAKGDPLKCEMFEELHGSKPDQFWD
jgi:hypothetical protein